MKLPRDLSGENLAKALCKSGAYEKVNRVGSHIILQAEEPESHRISVPARTPLRLRLGTLTAILRSVAAHKYVTRGRMISSL